MSQQPAATDATTTERQTQTSDMPQDSPLPDPIITTSRLIIRTYHPQDAPSMSLNGNTAAVAKYMSLGFPHPYTIKSAEEWIAMNAPSDHPAHFGICEASSPETVIGSIGLKLGGDVNSHTGELGFWVGEKYWSKGYVTEVVEAFTKWSFQSFEGKDGQRLRRLWAGVFSGNVGSMRCLQKCGYAPEGVMRGHAEKNGVVMDMHLFGLTKADWEARK